MNQDWERVVIGKGKSAGTKVKPEQAMRDGAAVVTEKKFGAGSNTTVGGMNAAKLDAETENFKHEKVPSSLAKNIQKARTAKGWTQAQLAQAINEKPQVVNQYESGKAIPNGQIINKMERVLGAKLRSPKGS